MGKAEIPFETLVAFISGELDPDTAEAIGAGLAASPRAAAEVAALREVVEAMRAGEDPDERVIERVIERAVSAIRRRPPVTTSLVAAKLADLGAAVARLVFDSRRPAAAVGLRGDGSAYQLAYDSGLGRIDLQVTSGRGLTDERKVRGQVVPREATLPGTIRLVDTERGATTAAGAVDVHGRFKLSTPVGVYDAVVGFAERPEALVLPGLELD